MFNQEGSHDGLKNFEKVSYREAVSSICYKCQHLKTLKTMG